MSVAPDIDESPRSDECPDALAMRLAQSKALVVAQSHPEAIVIGSDQVAMLDGCVLDKPGHFDHAQQQLLAMSGRQVLFHTAVSVMCIDTGFTRSDLSIVTVDVRRLTVDDIERYLQREQPYDCAGSAKCEGLGIALLDRIASDDPTALIGLPLIRTCALLREAGIDPLGEAHR
jgi:septum formation protein